MDKKKFAPESLMMSYGYNPKWSEGAIKPPIFQTSTFVFESAEDGKAFFELAYGLRDQNEEEKLGLIYSRINNPNLEILENRLALYDEAEDSAIFESGMSAISTVLLEFLSPGDVLLFSEPVYGGTHHFILHFLDKIGIEAVSFDASYDEDQIHELLQVDDRYKRLSMVYAETPANPTNAMIDIAMCRRIADQYSTEDKYIQLAIDNTYMGPLWCHPLEFGANLVIYSATKYLGGHSDLIAGAVVGDQEHIKRVKTLRTFLGNMASPNTSWLLLRSLETLKLRMEQQMSNAVEIAQFINKHEKVDKVYYPELLDPNSRNHKLYKSQYKGSGAMISFQVKGGEKEAFKFLNSLELFKLAVSLGGTESLAEHPATMTHAGVEQEMKDQIGITSNLVRLSIGIEYVKDLISDIDQALNRIQ